MLCHILILGVTKISKRDYYLIITITYLKIIPRNNVWPSAGELAINTLVSKAVGNVSVVNYFHPNSTSYLRLRAVGLVPEIIQKCVGNGGL